MNEILSVGLILIAALVAGHLAQLIRLPEVTGYILVGVLIGPGTFDLVTHDNAKTLGFLSEIALGVILFGIGAIFEAGHFARVGRAVLRVAGFETLATFSAVTLVMLLLGQGLPVAVLLGVVAMETAPATTLMVLHEYDASGPLTERLLALLALNNMIVLVTFGLVAAGLTLAGSGGGAVQGWFLLAYHAGHGLLWTTIGSVALGILLGLVVDAWAGRVKESGEALMLVMGVILVAVGASRALGLSPLFATLALGATVANTSHRGEYLLAAVRRADPPLFAAFFVLAGAELNLGSLGAIGLAGLAYVVARVAGKFTGAQLGLRGQDVPEPVRRHLGLCLLSSSSLAIGLTIQIRSSFPDLAPPVTGVVLAAVVVFEIVGPLLVRRSLLKTHEAGAFPASERGTAAPDGVAP